ncbi:MAG: dTMP kinase [Acidimicrobiales bacterium]
MRRRGRFVVFEGGEGSGKSTQARVLADQLDAVLTREPGGTAIGERVREVLLDRRVGHLEARAELLLMLAARAQHVAEYIRPMLDQGRDVVCDRFSPSTLAYQGYGRGLDLSAIRAADELARNGLEPDVVVLLDLSPEVASTRRSGARDRIEGEDDAFFVRVRNGYLALAQSEPDRFLVVDADGSIDEVSDRVRARLGEQFFARKQAVER